MCCRKQPETERMALPRELFRWPAYWQELFLERAAIMEYEGNLSRPEAEREAEKDIRRQEGN